MRDERLILSLSGALQEAAGRLVGLLTHAGGDPDSIGSAYVLKNILLKAYGARGVAFTIPGSPSTHSRALLNYLGLDVGDIERAEIFVVVDAGSPQQLEEYSRILGEGVRIIVVDHHETSAEAYGEGAALYASTAYQSVCEMVYELAEHVGYRLGLREAEALFLGIYYDTVRLSVADEESLRKVCRLAEMGVKPMGILAQLETAMDVSERVARLKAAARMKMYRLKEWYIVFSRVGSFQSSAARSLLSLGAHAAIVAGEADEGVQVSMRAVQDVVKAGLDLSRVAARLGEEFRGYGGGHSTAARAFCKEGDVEKVLRRCLELVSERLGAEAVEVRP